MAVSEQTGFDESTASGMTGVFPYTFKILRAQDMRVEIDGVVIDGLGAYTYEISGIGEDAGGNVTITPNPTAGTIVLRAYDAIFDRETNYQYVGDLKSPIVNSDFDRIWLAMQVLRRRALLLPFTEVGQNTLPVSPAGRARKALIFDDTGAPAVSTDDYEDQVANVAASAAEAAASAAVSTTQAGISIDQADRAAAEADDAENSANIAAAAVSGSVNTFFAATKTAADTLAASLPDGATVIVDRDETLGGVGVRYTVSSATLTSPVILNLNVVESVGDLVAGNADGVSVNVRAYHAGLKSGGGTFYWDASGDKADHNGGTVIDPARTFPSDWTNQTQVADWFTAGTGAGVWCRRFEGAVFCDWFGVSATYLDVTRGIQAACNAQGLLGGGEVVMPHGTMNISIFSSINTYACLVIPKGVHLRGAGKTLTTVTRPTAERAVDGILIVNKGFDTAMTVLGADGDLTFSDFTITDGAASPSRAGGDLIGLGNCANVLVERIHFGNHDQHGVDISGVNGIIVRDCTGLNQNSGAYRRSSTVQVDGANGGMIGQASVAYNSENVLVEHNDFKGTGTQEVLHVGHKAQSNGGAYKNIVFRHNRIDGAYASFQYLVYFDPFCGFDGLVFDNNEFIGNHANAYTLNIFLDGTQPGGNQLKNVRITNNRVTGLARVGILVGIGAGDIVLGNSDVVIKDNYVNITSDSTTDAFAMSGIQLYRLDRCTIENNRVYVRKSSGLGETRGIVVRRNADAVVKNNKVKVRADDLNAGNVSAAIIFGLQYTYESTIDVTIPCRTVISNNIIDQSSVRLALVVTSGVNYDPAIDMPVLSGNTFEWALIPHATVMSISDNVGASKLDNGGVDVVFSGGSTTLALTTSMDVTVDSYGPIRSISKQVRLVPSMNISGVGIEQVMPLVLGAGFSGMTWQAIGLVGTYGHGFTIRTGAAGVNCYMSLGAPTARASATLSMKAYI